MQGKSMGLLVSLASGPVGGNIAGALMQDKSLGNSWNSILGILGTVASSGVGGAVLLFAVSIFKK